MHLPLIVQFEIISLSSFLLPFLRLWPVSRQPYRVYSIFVATQQLNTLFVATIEVIQEACYVTYFRFHNINLRIIKNEQISSSCISLAFVS
jgi:hypothetical protein